MDTTQPKYKAIADDLRRRIAADEFEDGTLPGIAALQAHYDAALNTVRGAQDILEKEGLDWKFEKTTLGDEPDVHPNSVRITVSREKKSHVMLGA